MRSTLTRDELIAEFRWTWPRHKGHVTQAAPILGTTPDAPEKRLRMCRIDGWAVEFIDDRKGR